MNGCLFCTIIDTTNDLVWIELACHFQWAGPKLFEQKVFVEVDLFCLPQ